MSIMKEHSELLVDGLIGGLGVSTIQLPDHHLDVLIRALRPHAKRSGTLTVARAVISPVRELGQVCDSVIALQQGVQSLTPERSRAAPLAVATLLALGAVAATSNKPEYKGVTSQVRLEASGATMEMSTTAIFSSYGYYMAGETSYSTPVSSVERDTIKALLRPRYGDALAFAESLVASLPGNLLQSRQSAQDCASQPLR